MFVTGVEEITPYVGGVRGDSVAAEAGLRSDDVIDSVGGKPTATLDQALVAFFDELLSDGVIDLTVTGVDGSSRSVDLDVRDRVNELTEPDALFDGLGIVIGPQLLPVIDTVVEGQPADRAGLRPGDRIVAIDDAPIEFWRDLQSYISARPGESVSVSIVRNGEAAGAGSPREIDLEIATQEDDSGQAVGRIGISSPAYANSDVGERLYTVLRYGPIEGIGVASAETWQRSALSVRFLWRMVTGDVSLRNASGPIMIAAYAGDFAQAGFNRFLQFLAMISISLGIVNLLPVPILDGGQIVVAAIEGVKGKPISMRAAVIGQQIGLAMLIALMGFVFYNDISRLLGS
jgi:regulator of sigma E protease